MSACSGGLGKPADVAGSASDKEKLELKGFREDRQTPALRPR